MIEHIVIFLGFVIGYIVGYAEEREWWGIVGLIMGLLFGVVLGISIATGDFELKFDITALEATVSTCIGLFWGAFSARKIEEGGSSS